MGSMKINDGICGKILLAAMLFFLVFTLSPLVSHAEEETEELKPYFYYVVDENDKVFAVGTVVTYGNLAVVYTNMDESKIDATGCKIINFENENETFNIKYSSKLDQIMLWTITDSGAQSNHFLKSGKPVKEEQVACFYPTVKDDKISVLADEATILGGKKLENGESGLVTLSKKFSNVVQPAPVVNANGEFIGIYMQESVVFCLIFDEAVFEAGTGSTQGTTEEKQTEEPTEATTEAKGGENNKDIDPIKDDDKKDDDKGQKFPIGILAVIIVCIAAAAGGFIAYSKKKNKNTGGNTGGDESSGGGKSGIEVEDISVTKPENITVMETVRDDIATIPLIVEEYFLKCEGGYMDGRIYEVKGIVTIGRNPDCTIKYPEKQPGVSRTHATIQQGVGKLSIIDTSSTGVFIRRANSPEGMSQITKGQNVELYEGDIFYIGGPVNGFRVIVRR